MCTFLPKSFQVRLITLIKPRFRVAGLHVRHNAVQPNDTVGLRMSRTRCLVLGASDVVCQGPASPYP